ncbi:hypothetical protein EYZ11_003304 [Aspergillus tanneri]|uniref:Ubiquitin-like protease family profile domain-containing protein n=1 Tax=Aspergillus tanneri TaxID=1220188 RepID=A0A4S3JNR3_9EURO|nr:hypothetical protein EYZ11_003304 [Aspergillus tanneri]
MSGVFSTQQQPAADDTIMQDVTMVSPDYSPIEMVDLPCDPMDISPIPAEDKAQSSSQSMGIVPDSNTTYPPHRHVGFSHNLPASSFSGLNGNARTPFSHLTRTPFIRPLQRFSPKSRTYNPITGVIQPQISVSLPPNENRPSVLSRSDIDSMDTEERLKTLFRKSMVNPYLRPTTRDSSFNSLQTNKSSWIFDGKPSSFESNTSVTTTESSLSRKRSVDEVANDPSHSTTPEADIQLHTKYRRVSQEGFPASASLAHDALKKVLNEEATVPVQDEPSSRIYQRTVSTHPDSPRDFHAHLNFGRRKPSDSRMATLVEIARGHHARDNVPSHIPGEWPNLSPSPYSRRFTDRTFLPVENINLPGGQALMSGALPVFEASVAPTPATSDTADNPCFSSDSGMTQSQQVQTMAINHNGQLQNEQISSILHASWRVTCLGTGKVVGLVGRRRRPSHHVPTTSRESPARASLRSLPEEQRHRVRSNQWRIERGLATAGNLPFPELSFDIPPWISTAGPSLQRISDAISEKRDKNPKNTHKSKRKCKGKQANNQQGTISQSVSSSKVTKAKRRRSATSGVQNRSWVQPMTPSLERRMLPCTRGRRLTEAERERHHRAWRYIIEGPQQEASPPANQEPVLDDHHASNEPGAPIKPESPAAKKKLKVRFEEPLVNETEDAALTTEIAPHLHPTSPNAEQVASEKKQFDEQKENVPPLSEPEIVPNVEDSVFSDESEPTVDPWLQYAFPFGRAVSAVSLFYPHLKPIPEGRTESIYAAQWRQIEEEQRRQEAQTRYRPEGPAVRPLSDNWENRVSEAMALSNSRKVATTLSGDPLTKKDLATCYTPAAWLNDEVINSYLALIVDYLRRTNGNAGRHDKPRFHAFNSFFFSNLRDKGYQSVRRWASRAKIGGESLLDVDTVFIPVHNSSHWTLIVVQPSQRTIEHFDSLGSLSLRHVGVVKEWLKSELGPLYQEEEWTVLPSNSPQQDNGSDCGAFLLSTAKAVAIGLEPLSYCAADIGLLRRKIVAELMAGGLEGEFDPDDGSEVLL